MVPPPPAGSPPFTVRHSTSSLHRQDRFNTHLWHLLCYPMVTFPTLVYALHLYPFHPFFSTLPSPSSLTQLYLFTFSRCMIHGCIAWTETWIFYKDQTWIFLEGNKGGWWERAVTWVEWSGVGWSGVRSANGCGYVGFLAYIHIWKKLFLAFLFWRVLMILCNHKNCPVSWHCCFTAGGAQVQEERGFSVCMFSFIFSPQFKDSHLGVEELATILSPWTLISVWL